MIKLIAFIFLIVIFLIMTVMGICCLIAASRTDDVLLGDEQYDNVN